MTGTSTLTHLVPSLDSTRSTQVVTQSSLHGRAHLRLQGFSQAGFAQAGFAQAVPQNLASALVAKTPPAIKASKAN